MRNAIGIGVLLVAACAGPRVGDDVVGKLVVTGLSARAGFTNRAEPRDEIVEGACRTWSYQCAGSEGRCRFETGLSAGPILVAGPSRAITLEYDDRTDSYGTIRPGIPYTSGSELMVSAPGDEVDGFALTARAPEPFVDNDLPLQLPAFTGAPMTVTWTPSSIPDPEARVELAGYAGGAHAGTDIRLFECVGPDSGSLTIGPRISADFAARGGQADTELSRFHEAAHVVPGYEVRFRIATALTMYFND
jgi:hypothetical protein